jgi:phthalate 4,5-cis-dihydrodiol dehydrogenase
MSHKRDAPTKARPARLRLLRGYTSSHYLLGASVVQSNGVLRVGVVGLGRAGSGMLAALLVHPDVQVTAAADLHEEHLSQFKTDVGGETFTDLQALCASPLVDALYIATPHQFHADHVAMATAGGKHVIVEKPMGLTLEECDDMVAAAEAANVRLIVGHTASFNPAVQKMRQMVASGEVGRLAMMSATAYTDFMYRPRRPEELVTALGGGIMYNQVPHQVDACRYIAGGMVKSVRAATFVLDAARDTEGGYTAMLEFEDGAVANLVYSGYDHFDSAELASATAKAPDRYGAARRALSDVQSPDEEIARRIGTGYGGDTPVVRGPAKADGSLLQPELGSFIVTCEGADLRLAPDGVATYTTNGYKLTPADPWRGVQGRGNVIDELYYAVTEGRPTPHDGRWAKATMEVCFAMLESSRTSETVTLNHQVELGATS